MICDCGMSALGIFSVCKRDGKPILNRLILEKHFEKKRWVRKSQKEEFWFSKKWVVWQSWHKMFFKYSYCFKNYSFINVNYILFQDEKLKFIYNIQENFLSKYIF